MRKTFLVMRQELINTFKRKTYLFFALGLPLMLGLIALVVMLVNRNQPQTADTEPEPVETVTTAQGYVDLAGLVASEPPGIPAGTLLAYPDETAATAALTAGDIQGFFIISAEYLAGGQLTYVTDKFNLFAGPPPARLIEWLLTANLLDDPVRAAAVWQPLNLKVSQLPQPGLVDSSPDQNNWLVELLPTMMVFIIYMTIIIPSGALVNAVADEKKNRVLESVLVSVSSRQFITGKILALGLLGLVQIVMWMAVVYGVIRFGGQPLNIPPGFSFDTMLLVWIIIYSLLGYAMYGVLMAGLGALVPDVKDARSTSFILLIPLIVAYMFNIVVVELPNGPIALILSFFPLTGPVSMIGRMAAVEVPIWQGALAAVLQLAVAVALLLLVARLFQTKYLLSGQPFGIKRYFSALAGRV